MRVDVVEVFLFGGADAQFDADAAETLHRGDGLREAVAGGAGRRVEAEREDHDDHGGGRYDARKEADKPAARAALGDLRDGCPAVNRIEQAGFQPFGNGGLETRGYASEGFPGRAESLGACRDRR